MGGSEEGEERKGEDMGELHCSSGGEQRGNGVPQSQYSKEISRPC